MTWAFIHAAITSKSLKYCISQNFWLFLASQSRKEEVHFAIVVLWVMFSKIFQFIFNKQTRRPRQSSTSSNLHIVFINLILMDLRLVYAATAYLNSTSLLYYCYYYYSFMLQLFNSKCWIFHIVNSQMGLDFVGKHFMTNGERGTWQSHIIVKTWQRSQQL